MFRRSTGSCLVSIRRDGKALWLADKQAVFMIHPHWLSPWLFVYLQACACASLCVLLCFPVAFKFLYNSGLHKGSFVQWGFFLFIYNFFVKLNATSFVLQFNKEERKKAVCCMCSAGQDAPTAGCTDGVRWANRTWPWQESQSDRLERWAGTSCSWLGPQSLACCVILAPLRGANSHLWQF